MKNGSFSEQSALLTRVLDDVIYIMESLFQNLTGEAKSSLSDLMSAIEGMVELDPAYREALSRDLNSVLDRLRYDDEDSAARDGLIHLRRSLSNTLLAEAGKPSKYAFADAWTAKNRRGTKP